MAKKAKTAVKQHLHVVVSFSEQPWPDTNGATRLFGSDEMSSIDYPLTRRLDAVIDTAKALGVSFFTLTIDE
jgi:hypothetical protein